MATVFEEVCGALNRAGVRYVVVGGVAVVLHGHPRLTADLDLIIDLEPEQVRAALDVLVDQEFRPRLPVDPRSFADPEARREWIEELWEASDVVDADGTDIRIASIDHLIRLKEQAARPQDVSDIGRKAVTDQSHVVGEAAVLAGITTSARGSVPGSRPLRRSGSAGWRTRAGSRGAWVPWTTASET